MQIIKRDSIPLLIITVIVLFVLMLGNPYSNAWFLKCPLFYFTGYQCPLCGIQRQLHALLHLQWAEAWRLNAGLLILYPYLILLFLGQLNDKIYLSKLGRWAYSNSVQLIFVLYLIAWGLYRNFHNFLNFNIF